MNLSTLLGFGLGLILIGLVIALTAHDARAYFDGASLLVVIGGTIAATLVSYPMAEVRRVLLSLRRAMHEEKLAPGRAIDELVEMAKHWNRGDAREVENRLQHSRNGFLRTGVQLLLDKAPPEDVMTLLQWRIARLKAKERAEAQIFRSMAAFAPAFGMVGTLLGLINMLQIMADRNLMEIGANMALALITTFYGLLLANLVFKPVAIKLERHTEQRVMLMTMVMEGISLLSQRRSPAVLRETLQSFIYHYDNELDAPPLEADEPDFNEAPANRVRTRQAGALI
ncbi:chemotaxis protein MotA [Permianibacter sp. IMCC34836]|uniref:motility protein A n=1 Tax=Permianibacter fluminis TaxID=2738515 RepID=UPI001553FE97|nr:MotA/TolQ/ExbB proton channel family protein [Permianibacter fluminis]NQD37236.1 chemotaxis protein MotA [Permianibacter fluminis]